MTAPGSVVAPQPGWWVRPARVGTNASSYGWSASMGGIPSAEAFGLPTITPGTVIISPAGIASAQRFGAPNVMYSQSVTPAGIASAEAFGTPQVVATYLAPSGIASGEVFGAPRIDQALHAAGIVSAEAFGSAKVGLFIAPAGIRPAESFGAPAVNLLPPLFDAVGAGSNATSGTAVSTSLTAALGADVLVDVFVNSNVTVSSPTYGSTAATLVGGPISPNNVVTNGIIYRYRAARAGTGTAQSFTGTLSGSSAWAAVPISFTNMNSVGSAQTVTGTGTTASQTVSSATNQLILQCFLGFGALSTWGSLTGGTNRYNAHPQGVGQVAVNTATTSTTFSATAGSSQPWVGLANVLS